MDTVLIVDDSSFIVEGLISLLKKKYRPLAAYGGAECLEILKREIPAVIILDIMMEPVDGWETLARIKENPATRHIPVLMFSADKISPKVAGEHHIRFEDFITKPVSPQKIIEAIDKVLTRRDVYRTVVETWKAAGISREKIDEYLSLVTSLEVDLSLCQNLKIQYDLVPPEDTSQAEFQAVITAIEDRIRQEREQVEGLARGMNDVLVHRSGTGAGAGSSFTADEPAGRHQDEGTGSCPRLFGSLVPDRESSGPLAADPGAVVEADSRTENPGSSGAIAVNDPPVSCTVPDHPNGDPAGSDPAREREGPASVLSESPAGPVPAPGEPSSHSGVTASPDGVPVTSTRDTGSMEHGSRMGGEDNRIPATETGTAPLSGSPASSPLLPVHDTPVPEERKVIPADPDIPPDTRQTVSPTGAGTDGPMPWDTVKERKPQRLLIELAEKNASFISGSSKKPHGIVARLLSFVLSLLGKRS